MPNQNLKILHSVRTFSGLSETFVYQQIIGLDEIGLDNYVVTEKRINERERPFANVAEIPLKKKAPFFIRKYNKLIKKNKNLNFKHEIEYHKWNKLLLHFSPDIIHCHFGKEGYLVYHVMEQLDLKIPLLISFHGTDTLNGPKTNKEYKAAILSLSKKYRCIFTCPSRFLRDKALANIGISGDHVHIVPNGFSTDFLSFYIEKDRPSGDNFSIINVGRFIKFKGQDYLIQAFNKFLKHVTDRAKLTLVGFGEEKGNLTELVARLGISDKVTFIESMPHKEMPFLLQQHDLYIQPSITDPLTGQAESFGVSILEAVAVGLPVIVTDSGGMADTILGGDGKTAIIVPEKNIHRLCDAMTSLFYEYSRINNNLRHAIVNKYSHSNNVALINNLYQHLIN